MSVQHDPVQRADFDQVMVPSYAPAAFVPVRGAGSRVWDQSGRELIDFSGGIAVNALGHAHPALVKALTEQAGKLWHVSNVFTNEPALRLAKKLVDATFAERVFLCNSGAEANEAAFKLARRVAHDRFGADKYEIIAATNSFHGRTLFTVSVGGQPKYSDGFGPKIQGITHVPYNDLEALKAAISDKTCAVVIEPIQGEGGVRPVPKEFMRELRRICDEKGLLLILDEVQTGVGRTGKFFAHEWLGVAPDIMAIAKGIGGGFPFGACLATAEAASGMKPGIHGTTYGGNPLAMACGNAVLDIVLADGFLENVRDVALVFRQGLAALKDRFPEVIEDIRGEGLLLGIKAKIPAGDLVTGLRNEKMLAVPAGDNVVRLLPPLVVTAEEAREGLARIERAAEALTAEQLKKTA